MASTPLYKRLSLSQAFTLASLLILLASALGIGWWVGRQITLGVIRRTGATTALFVDSFVAPYLQPLAQSGSLPAESIAELERLLGETPMGQQIVDLRVWNPRGTLLFASDPALIGQAFPMGEELLRARLGDVVSSVSTLDDEENQNLGGSFDRLLETYSPVWLSGTGEVLAVVEFYQRTDALDQEIAAARRQTWLVVGLVIGLAYLLLTFFVRRTSQTIAAQQAALGEQVSALSQLLAQNRELGQRVRRASGSVAMLNESYLRRIGSELHDGPAQDLGLSLLKLDALLLRLERRQDGIPAGEVSQELGAVESAMQNALKEMRAIAAGLNLPELKDLDLAGTVERVVRGHERRTGSPVALELGPLPPVPMPVKITTYRLVQEALNNAYRHAGGAGQRVTVADEAGTLLVSVSDSGPGFDAAAAARAEGRLGLAGMRERVESLGGQFQITSAAGVGTTVTARLPLIHEGEKAAADGTPN